MEEETLVRAKAADPVRTFTSDDSTPAHHEATPVSRPGARRWAVTALLVISLAVVSAALYVNNQSPQRRGSSSAVPEVRAAERPAVPSPYRELLPSVVQLDLTDSAGVRTSTAGGFFIKPDTVATSLTAVAGVNAGEVVAAGARYEIKGVTADRVKGVALLKVAGPPAAAPLAEAKEVAQGSGVVVLSAQGDGHFSGGTITGVRDRGGVLEISLVEGEAEKGAPVVNAEGKVAALVTGDGEEGKVLAVPATSLAEAVKSKQPQMSLRAAGAAEVLFDFRGRSVSESPENKFDKVPREEARRVLDAMFPAYLTDSSQCEDYESPYGADDRL